MKTLTKNILLLILVGLIAIFPLIIKSDAEFEGADVNAQEAILEINPSYEPWFEPLWEPPSGEIESLVFSLQAALGSGVIFYVIGYMKGKKNSANNR